MRIPYNITGEKRKALVRIVSETTGETAVYKYMPTCAYEVGPYTVTKDGALEFEDGTDCAAVLAALAAAGFEAGTGRTEEGLSLTATVPMGDHTGETLRNLVSLVFTRGKLINRALGTSFRVDTGLMETLKTSEIKGKEDFLRAAGACEDGLGGLTFTPERITFSSLPDASEPEAVRAFTELCAMMNRQALTQKRIQAKAVADDNEKYAMRIWLTRLGMNGPEFKETRKVLMRNLSGHSAFRTEEDKERWTQRQAQKRAAAKQP